MNISSSPVVPLVPRHALWTVAACLLCLGARAAVAVPPTEPKPPARSRSALPPPSSTPAAGAVQPLDWDALLPPDKRDHFNDEPPAPIHDYLGEKGMAAMQSGSSEVNHKLDKANVKIPGFVVPLDILPTGMVREFFLVPYFGACIHVPPPPPNQIVYVKLATPVKVGSMSDAVWITGVLHIESKMSRFGAAAYTLDGMTIEPYKY
jgi:hypothetical protein